MSDTPASTLMIVDDTPVNLHLLGTMLQQRGYQVRAFPNGRMAVASAERDPPDLILLDVLMPEQNGYQVCLALKALPQLSDIPILFLSALGEVSDKVRGFEAGGVDYITKPFQIDEVQARIELHLELKRARDALRRHNSDLNQTIEQQIEQLTAAHLSTILALSKLAESRDDDTGQHIERMCRQSRLLAESLIEDSDRPIDADQASMIGYAAALHDIGKVGIPDAVLLKPGRLTPEEFAIIQRHPVIGYETLQTILNHYPNNRLIHIGAEVARWHHERWDGSGYPDGLVGSATPISARVVAIADVYDALRSRRPYKQPMSREQAAAIIREGFGSHFDPALAAAFDRCEPALAACPGYDDDAAA